VQSIAIHPSFMAEDDPGRLKSSSIRRWLDRTHGVIDRLPVFDGYTAVNNYKNDLRARINTLKATKLHQYYPTSQPGANCALSCWISHGQNPHK
jgi:hypothetical protein